MTIRYFAMMSIVLLSASAFSEVKHAVDPAPKATVGFTHEQLEKFHEAANRHKKLETDEIETLISMLSDSNPCLAEAQWKLRRLIPQLQGRSLGSYQLKAEQKAMGALNSAIKGEGENSLFNTAYHYPYTKSGKEAHILLIRQMVAQGKDERAKEVIEDYEAFYKNEASHPQIYFYKALVAARLGEKSDPNGSLKPFGNFSVQQQRAEILRTGNAPIRKEKDIFACEGERLTEITSKEIRTKAEAYRLRPESYPLEKIQAVQKFEKIFEGHDQVCGLRKDNTLYCWGDADSKLEEATKAGKVKNVVAGYRQTCAIKADDTLFCWGDERRKPEEATKAGKVKNIVAGYGQTCAIKTDDTLFCWGDADQEPEEAGKAGKVKNVIRGFLVTCAIKMDDTLFCWGDANGKLEKVTKAGKVKSVVNGDGLTCAIKADDTLFCWGDERRKPEEATKAGKVKNVVAGYGQTCAIKTDDTLFCWGHADWKPAEATRAGKVKNVIMGSWQTCAIKLDNTLFCWGAVRGKPEEAIKAGEVKNVIYGFAQTCAIKVDDSLFCWGDGSGKPEEATKAGKVKDVIMGNWQMCAHKQDNSIYCWGEKATPKELESVTFPCWKWRDSCHNR